MAIALIAGILIVVAVTMFVNKRVGAVLALLLVIGLGAWSYMIGGGSDVTFGAPSFEIRTQIKPAPKTEVTGTGDQGRVVVTFPAGASKPGAKASISPRVEVTLKVPSGKFGRPATVAEWAATAICSWDGKDLKIDMEKDKNGKEILKEKRTGIPSGLIIATFEYKNTAPNVVEIVFHFTYRPFNAKQNYTKDVTMTVEAQEAAAPAAAG